MNDCLEQPRPGSFQRLRNSQMLAAGASSSEPSRASSSSLQMSRGPPFHPLHLQRRPGDTTCATAAGCPNGADVDKDHQREQWLFFLVALFLVHVGRLVAARDS